LHSDEDADTDGASQQAQREEKGEEESDEAQGLNDSDGESEYVPSD
jgi:hypothetical protein